MSHVRTTQYLFAALAAFFSFVFLTACQTATTREGYLRAETGDDTTSISVPEGVSRNEAHQAVLYALTKRGWTIDDGEPIRARLNHRGVEAELEFEVNADKILIVSNSRDEEGVPIVPIRWINFLEEDIRGELAEAILVE